MPSWGVANVLGIAQDLLLGKDWSAPASLEALIPVRVQGHGGTGFADIAISRLAGRTKTRCVRGWSTFHSGGDQSPH